jgi:tRNA(His) 5'-end guanylyltransferase
MDSLGDRMKTNYENSYRIYLTRRTPAIIRIDGKAFHTFTKGLNKPYDLTFKNAMWKTTQYLCENIQNARLGYVQSDEISILMIDYNKFTTSAWFDNNIQKICSVSASMATMAFNTFFALEASDTFDRKEQYVQYPRYASFALVDARPGEFLSYQKKFGCATFDSRVFNIPEKEVCNYFIWRQLDATRNSIEMVGQAHFAQNKLNGVSCNQIQDMLHETFNINWNDFPTEKKRGSACIRNENSIWVVDHEMPILKGEDRNYVDRFIFVGEE